MPQSLGSPLHSPKFLTILRLDYLMEGEKIRTWEDELDDTCKPKWMCNQRVNRRNAWERRIKSVALVARNGFIEMFVALVQSIGGHYSLGTMRRHNGSSLEAYIKLNSVMMHRERSHVYRKACVKVNSIKLTRSITCKYI